MVLRDGCGRPLLNLRLGITQHCNLRCEYCHMEGEEKCVTQPRTEMTVDEIVHIVTVAVRLGLCRVKLTGGEPLARNDAVQVVKGISAISGLRDLSMTTNGVLLAPLAKDLYASGLKRVNVNLPTLDETAYSKLTGGRVKDSLEGIETAIKVGFNPVKINMLVLRGVNDNAVDEMIDFARRTGAILQLIELEPINITDAYYSLRHKPLDEYEEKLKQEAVKVETREHMQNRRIYHLQNVKVEIIRPTENADFCMHCTRLRVTSTGKLKTCLMKNDNLVDVLTPIRKGANDREIEELFRLSNQERQPYNKN